MTHDTGATDAAASKYGFVRWVTQDWRVNAAYPDSLVVVTLFRLAQWSYRRWGPPGLALAFAYRMISSLLLGVELPHQIEVGPRLRVFHPHGIVVNAAARLGSDCVLRQNVTIGNAVRRDGSERGVARAGDGVDFGAGCVVVGDIFVGHHARVAALALVIEDVPDYGVVRGNPAVLVRVDTPPGPRADRHP